MAQFRVEFVLDPASGSYLVELYHPENEDEILVRTEPLYATPAAAVLGVVQLFKEAIGEVPRPRAKARPAARRKKLAPRKAVRKAAKRRKHR